MNAIIFRQTRKTRRMVESAVMIAIATVLSLFEFQGPWALGGGITFCSMLPLVVISHRYGVKWGFFTALVHSILQMFLGLKNVQYADSAVTAVLIILFDYVVAFSVIGLAAMFDVPMGKNAKSLVLGIVVTFLLRLCSHFISGWIVWERLWPNELGWAPPVWSIAYNASYMVPEIIITSVVAVLLYRPLGKYLRGEDLQ